MSHKDRRNPSDASGKNGLSRDQLVFFGKLQDYLRLPEEYDSRSRDKRKTTDSTQHAADHSSKYAPGNFRALLLVDVVFDEVDFSQELLDEAAALMDLAGHGNYDDLSRDEKSALIQRVTAWVKEVIDQISDYYQI